MSLENTWTWADIVQLLAGFILFMVGTWIGKNQEKSIKQTKGLTEKIDQSVSETQTLTQKINKSVGLTEGIAQKIDKSVSKTQTLTQDINGLTKKIDQSVSETQTLTQDIKGLTEKIDQSVSQTQTLTQEINKSVGLTEGIAQKINKSVGLTEGIAQEIKSLQTGLSELEMSEKIGVIEWGLNRVSQREAGAAPALLYDCLAVLPILEFSGEPLANKYANLLLKSLELLTEHYSVDNNPMAAILIADSLKAIEKLKSRGRQEIAENMTDALARYLDSVKYNDKQKAEEICSYLLQPETVKLVLNLGKGETLKISRLLAPCNQIKLDKS
ncbi:hypothetical protein [Floridanema aerugineum]|uniref:Uncharacterized protein n=1 Tax=Floridaenema aerugineum BLCC-F46 TaxID=3153654 RepID=A0ABV4X1G2_9CYAN